MAKFYVQLENKLLQISGELTAENISKALGYVPASRNVTNELTQRVDNITFDSLKDNPFLQDGSGELNIVDEAGNIIAKINADGIHSVDFIAGEHKLSDKTDKTYVDEVVKNVKVDLTGYATEEYVNNIDFYNINNNPIVDGEENSLTLVDENGNIGLKVTEDGLHVKDVIADNHKLTDKIDSSALNGYATEEWVENKNYLTEHQDISHLATKDEVSNIDFYNIKDNPIVNNGDGKLLFVDENGYIGLQLEEDGLYVKDVIADGHTLSQKADKSELSNYATKDEVSDLVDMSVVTELQGKVNTLIDTDADKSVRDIAVDVLTETLVSETATEAYDTLAEMSAWIKSHPDDASAMNTAIQKNATDITNLDAAYKAADSKVLTDAQEYTDNINFFTIKDNPIVDGEAGSITFVDETGYIGLKVTEDGIVVKDVVTPEHTLSNKADKSFVEDNYYDKLTADKKIAEAVTGGQISLDGFATEQWVNEQGFLKEHQDISHLAEKSELPTKTSDLTNDSGFITINDVPEVTVPTKTSDLTNDSGYITIDEVPDVTVPAKVSELENDKGYLTEHQDISHLATKAELPTVPTKVSELENDSKFITIDEVTEVVVPTKTSELTNDSGFITDTHLDNNIMWVKAEGESGIRLKGTNGTATGNLAISAGDDKTASDGTLFTSEASGDHAVAFGYGNTCSGRTTLAQGLYNIVTAKDSVAFGQRNLVDGDQAFAAGQQNEVTARLGVAIGYKNKSTNTDSIAIGYQNTSNGSASVAMGDTCEASGTSSTAMGYKTKATGAYSSTFGENTQATNEGEVAMGLYNKSTTSTEASEQTAFSFGIGTSDTNRVNAFEIKKNGDVYIGDKLLSGGSITEETDPIFSASPAASITNEKMVEWDKGSTALQSSDIDAQLNIGSSNPIQNKVVTEALNTIIDDTVQLVEGLLDAFDNYQPIISDLEIIRSGASKGATALQSVPEGYATEAWVGEQGFLTEHQNISHLATKEELNNKADKSDLEGLATESYVITKVAEAKLEGSDITIPVQDVKVNGQTVVKDMIANIDLTPYAKSEDVPSIEGLATEQWVTDKNYLTQHQDISHLASTEYVNEQIANVDVTEQLKDYALKSELPVNVSELNNDKGYLTEHQDISHLATKDEIPSLEGYAKTEDIPSLNGYVQSSELPNFNEFAKTDDIPSLEGYAKTEDIPSLEEYAKKSDIPSLDGYAKTEDLPNFEEFAKTEDIPSLDDYAKTEDIPSLDGYAKTSDIPSLDGYAKTEDIPSLEGYLKADDLGNISLEGYATEQYVNDQVSNIKVPSIEHLATKDELTEINFYDIHDNPILNTEDGKLLFVDEAGNIGLRLEQDNILYVKDVIAGDHVLSSKADKIDLNGLATEDYVNTKVANATPDVELAVEDVKVNGESVIINKVANIDLSGYAKTSDIPSLDGYAKTADIPTLNGYATETYVGEKIAEIEIPSLEGYATEQWVNNKNYATEYDLKNIDYSTINNVPVSEDETGELNVTDESGNIGMKVASEAVYAKDFIAGEHKLSEKVDKTYVDDSIVEAPTVKYVAQSLTPDQKLQARSNIGASDGTKSVVYLGGTTILINHMEPYVVYAAGGVYNSVTINGVVTNHDGVPLEYAEYTLVFQTGTNCTLQLPNTIYWANGVIPSIEDNTIYELSISFSKCAGVSTYRAVLIPFKRVS